MSKTTTLLATLLVALAPATSSAFSAPETRVRGIDLGAETRVGASSLRTPGSHLGISLLGCELASDRTYAASNPLRYADPDGLFPFGGFPVENGLPLPRAPDYVKGSINFAWKRSASQDSHFRSIGTEKYTCPP